MATIKLAFVLAVCSVCVQSRPGYRTNHPTFSRPDETNGPSTHLRDQPLLQSKANPIELLRGNAHIEAKNKDCKVAAQFEKDIRALLCNKKLGHSIGKKAVKINCLEPREFHDSIMNIFYNVLSVMSGQQVELVKVQTQDRKQETHDKKEIKERKKASQYQKREKF